jgi:hypothetical protein
MGEARRLLSMVDVNELPSLFGRVTSVLTDHARLKGTVQELRAACSLSSAATRDSLHGLTVGFVVLLREHFSAEESDGNFGEICRQRPDLDRIVVLRRLEHDQMRSILDDLERSGPRLDVSDLATVVIGLLHLLERHEAEESALMRHFVFWSQTR